MVAEFACWLTFHSSVTQNGFQVFQLSLEPNRYKEIVYPSIPV